MAQSLSFLRDMFLVRVTSCLLSDVCITFCDFDSVILVLVLDRFYFQYLHNFNFLKYPVLALYATFI